jgi:competence/damage-inducible protein cinA C-terminal domain
MQEIIKELTNNHQTIATMESCTGGALASEITNYPGASEILKFSAVTYSNEYKIKMGVDKNIIDKYSVYSPETAVSMSKAISNFADADYGIGITGKFNAQDPHNLKGADNIIFVNIYKKSTNENFLLTIKAQDVPRMQNKTLVIAKIITKLKEII